MTKQTILRSIFGVWIILWAFFLLREDKAGQYRLLGYLYTHRDYGDRTRCIMGGALYDFLVFCRENIPAGSTYELLGFEKFSVDKVRARYFLWPLKSVGDKADFKIVYGAEDVKVPGYREYKKYGSTGHLLVIEDSGPDAPESSPYGGY